MFDPVEFFHIARKLRSESKNPDAGTIRTCIGRAYYAAFLVAREKYAIKDGGTGVHQAVIKNCKKRVPKIGNQLDTLRINRNIADYKLGDNSALTKRDADNALRQAKEILQSLGKKIDD